MLKYLFKRDTIFATFAVFVMMGLFSLLPLNTHFLDPFKMVIRDFDYNDLAYAEMGKNHDSKTDTGIVVVNIGEAGRKEIAGMIEAISSYKPAVIGVDAVFDEAKDPAGDSLLKAALSNNKVVMAYNLNINEEEAKPSGLFFNTVSHKGYVNFVGEQNGVIRNYSPFIEEKEKHYESFAASLIKVASPAKYKALVEREHETEIINYSRSQDKYFTIDGDRVLEGKVDGSVLAGKIIVLGYVSRAEHDIEDKHFTPMNENFTGKAIPDMNGVFVHANIIQMILHDDYVAKTPSWINWFIAVVLCWIHMAVFIKYYLEHHIWFHLAAKIAQLLSAVLFVYIGLWLFYHNLQINMVPALAAIVLAVDVLYFYEAFATWLHKKTGYKTIFHHANHH